MIDLNTYRPVSFSSCVNPYYIRDNHGNLQKVRCGVCPQCRQSSKNRTSSLLQMEIKNWRYCVFFTLTYNNKWLPKIHTFRDDCGFLRLSPEKRLLPFLPKVCFYGEYQYRLVDGVYSRLEDSFQFQRVPPITNWSSPNDFGILFYRDVQLFKKRFIKNYFNYVKSNYPELFTKGFPQYKFFYCGEYGSRSLRPHFHLLFLFDRPELVSDLRQFADFAYNSWSVRKRVKGYRNKYSIEHFADYRRFTIQGDDLPKGERPNFSFVPTSDSSSVASYVSSYVSSSSCVPRLLSFKPWRAKTITPRGKYGSFGSHKNERQEVMQKVVYLASRPKVCLHYGDYFQKVARVYSDKSQSFEFVTLPYSASVIRSLFCKPFGYSQISYNFVKSVFKAVFVNVCRAFQRYKKLGEFYSFDEFIRSSDFRSIVLTELIDNKEYIFYYRRGIIQESFWLFLRNGFRTMYEYHLTCSRYLELFFFVHNVLLPQVRLCKFYQEQNLLIESGYDISSMYDNLSECPKLWFNTVPKYRFSKDILLDGVSRRFESILFTHLKHHSRSNIS